MKKQSQLYTEKSIEPTNLELEAICKTLRKVGIVLSLLSVTYGDTPLESWM